MWRRFACRDWRLSVDDRRFLPLLSDLSQVDRSAIRPDGRVFRGDVRSANWDGGGDLSGGADSGATAGYLIDYSSGAMQVQAIYAEGGSIGSLTVDGVLTMGAGGKLQTAPDGNNRVEFDYSSFETMGFFNSSDVEVGSLGIATGNLWMVTSNSKSMNIASDTTLHLSATTGNYIQFLINGAEVMSVEGGGLSGPAVEWSTWTPTIANCTEGNGTKTGRYVQIGDTVIATFRFTFGSTSSLSGAPTVTLPVTAASTLYPIGTSHCDNAGVASYHGTCILASTTTASPRVSTASGSYTQNATLSSTVPFTFGSGDRFAFTIVYEAA